MYHSDRLANASLHGSYKYEPLPGKTHIRLLIINPGAGEDVLSGSMITVDLDAPELASFEAISYTWGSGEKDQPILINERSLLITRSLKEAILQTRLPERPRILWADSICINQDDIVEKGYQVSAMGRIYKASSRTLICLGLEPHNEHKAVEAAALIKEVDAMIDATMRDLAFKFECDAFPWPSENDPLVDDARWLSAWEFLVRHPWFERGWVVQEAALGSDALIHWAGAHIEWMSLLRVDNWLYYRAIPSARPGQQQPSDIDSLHSDNFHLRRHEEAKTFVSEYLDSSIQALTTLSVLQHARKMRLTDPRDRIYAFTALKTADGVMVRLNLQPDYTRPHKEVFHQFAVKYLEETLDLDILTHVDHDEHELVNLRGVPSWVPCWDNGANVSPYHVHDSSCQPFATEHNPLKVTDIIEGSKLRLRGVVIGPIHFASRRIVKDLKDPVAEVLALWRQVTAEANHRPGPFRKSLGFEFLDAISLGRHRGELAQWEDAKREFAEYLELHNEVDQLAQTAPDPPIRQHAHRISQLALNRMENRRVIVLEQGFIGVTSAAARQGDLCALVNGLCSPLILRPVSDHPDHYILVGNAYVLRGTRVVDGVVHPLRMDKDHVDWMREHLQVGNIVLV